MNLELFDEQAAAPEKELHDIVENDRYPFSPRIRTLRDILHKIRPEPKPEPLPSPRGRDTSTGRVLLEGGVAWLARTGATGPERRKPAVRSNAWRAEGLS